MQLFQLYEHNISKRDILKGIITVYLLKNNHSVVVDIMLSIHGIIENIILLCTFMMKVLRHNNCAGNHIVGETMAYLVSIK